MTTLDDLNQAAASLSGDWVRLKTKADGAVEGRVVSFEVRDKTFEGEPVLNRKTKQVRKEWVFTLDTGNGEIAKLSLNESAQRAVSAALTEAGVQAQVGDILKIAVKADAASDREQAVYQAKWTRPAGALNVPTVNEEPF